MTAKIDKMQTIFKKARALQVFNNSTNGPVLVVKRILPLTTDPCHTPAALVLSFLFFLAEEV